MFVGMHDETRIVRPHLLCADLCLRLDEGVRNGAVADNDIVDHLIDALVLHHTAEGGILFDLCE